MARSKVLSVCTTAAVKNQSLFGIAFCSGRVLLLLLLLDTL